MPKAATTKKPDDAPAGLGNMNADDLAAIRGTLPEDEPEGLTSGAPASDVVPMAQASPEEVSLGARVLTLESRMSDLEAAVENLARATTGAAFKLATGTPLASAEAPVSTHKPTEIEAEAYFKANYEATSTGGKAFNGIQDWRNQGSPGLKR